MTRNLTRAVFCPNELCRVQGNVVPHGYSKVNWGRRRRYRCKECGKTFGATTGTPYKRLQHTMHKFDRVAALRVEGVCKSAIARLEGLSWNTVARWQALAAAAAGKFNHLRTCGYDLTELQLDELATFLQSKKRQTWVFAAIQVWSGLWSATLVGARTYQNTKRFVRSVADAAITGSVPLITTDGFKFYTPAIRCVFGPVCVLGQVIKKIRNNRVVRVATRTVIGAQWKLDRALAESEDSTKLNTAFIERLNLTIRQGSAYLNRRSPCHARRIGTLEEGLELLRCYYNFCRPHESLRFGREVRTPAMQAGLATRKLSFREIFSDRVPFVLVLAIRSSWAMHQRRGEVMTRAA